LEQIQARLAGWCRADTHHKGDPAVPPPSGPQNARIVPRTVAAGRSG
jgi:hypothetical protein